jgi:hypothetical protein
LKTFLIYLQKERRKIVAKINENENLGLRKIKVGPIFGYFVTNFHQVKVKKVDSVTGSYVDVPKSHYQAVRMALF